jgi:S-adenosylmethionine decarboxylase proenzyme
MHGLHLTADLRGCSPEQPAMTDPAQLRELCMAAVRDAGLHPVGELFHRFEPGSRARPPAPVGITGVVLLAESHLAVHTWPELGAVTVDVYVCNFQTDNSHQAHVAMSRLIAGFAAREVTRQALQRGAVAERL